MMVSWIGVRVVVGLARERWVLLALGGVDDGEALVQERQLAHAVGERVEAVLRCLEDAGVRVEVHLRARPFAVLHRAHLLQRPGRDAGLVRLRPYEALARHLNGEQVGERVHAAHADAVEAAGDLVGVLVELAARVEHGHHDLDGGQPHLRVDAHRDATPVVRDRDRVVRVDHDVNMVAVARERLVDGVVDDLVDEVVQTADAHVADVHGGALADGL